MLLKAFIKSLFLQYSFKPWSRHQMEAFSALLDLCVGKSPVTGEFHAQRPVTRSFDVFFDLRLNKRLSKQWWGWWFETPSRPLWRHCNAMWEFILQQMCELAREVRYQFLFCTHNHTILYWGRWHPKLLLCDINIWKDQMYFHSALFLKTWMVQLVEILLHRDKDNGQHRGCP